MERLRQNKLFTFILISLVLIAIIIPTIIFNENKNNDPIDRIHNSFDLMETMPFYDSALGGATSYYITVSTSWPDMTSKQKIEHHLYVQGVYNYSSPTGFSLVLEPIPFQLLHFSSGLISIFDSVSYISEWSDSKGNHSFQRMENEYTRDDLETDFNRIGKNVSTSYYPGYFEILETNGFDNSGFEHHADIEIVVSNSIAREWYYGVTNKTNVLKQLVQIRFTIQTKFLTKSLIGWGEVTKSEQIFGGDLLGEMEVIYPIWLVPYMT